MSESVMDRDGLLGYIKGAAVRIGGQLSPEGDWDPFAWLQAPDRMVLVELKEFWQDGAEGRELATLALAAAAEKLPADLFGIVSSAWFAGDLEALSEGREPEPLDEGAAAAVKRGEGLSDVPARREGLLVEVADAAGRIVEVGIIERSDGAPVIRTWLRMPENYTSRFTDLIGPRLVVR